MAYDWKMGLELLDHGGLAFHVQNPDFSGGAAVDGSTDDYAAVNAAHTAATVSGGFLWFPPGTCVIGTNLTINADVTVAFAPGAVLQPASGVTITINGQIFADPTRQIFDTSAGGSFDLSGSDLRSFSPAAWGAVFDGTTDDYTAVNAAHTAATAVSGELVFPFGACVIGTNLSIDSDVTLRVEPGATLKPSTGITVTINGPVHAGRKQCFDITNGTVTFGANAAPDVVVMPEWWGADPTGTNDSTDAWQAAIDAADAAGGGTVRGAGSATYKITTGEITLPDNTGSNIIVEGRCTMESSCSGNVFLIDSAGSGASGARHIIREIEFTRVSGSEGSGVAIKVTDSSGQIIEEVNIFDYDKGILLENGTSFVEATRILNVAMRACNYGIYLSKGSSSSASLAGTSFVNVQISAANAQAATAYCFYVNTDANMYRSAFLNLNLFPSKNNAVAFYCDGRLQACFGQVNMEDPVGVTGNVGWSFGSSASNLNFDIFCDLRDNTIATRVTNASSNPIEGLHNRYSASGSEFIRCQGVLTNVASIADEDSTIRLLQLVTAGDIVQFRSPDMVQFRDRTTTTLVKPVQNIPVQRARYTATDGDTTPSVTGIGDLYLSQTSATTITDFDNPEGQGHVVMLIFADGNTTVSHNANILLAGSTNFTGAAGDTLTLRYDATGGVWREIGRAVA